MYESPIELLVTDIHRQIVEQQEDAVYKAVLNFVPNIDKGELIRALRYDREQYAKGYADGKADAEKSLVRCKDCEQVTWLEEYAGSYYPFCTRLWAETREDGFCSYGERKDGGKENAVD